MTLTKISDSQSWLSIRTTWEFISYLIRIPGSKIQTSEFFKDPYVILICKQGWALVANTFLCPNQQHLQYLETCWKYKFFNSIVQDLVNQKLQGSSPLIHFLQSSSDDSGTQWSLRLISMFSEAVVIVTFSEALMNKISREPEVKSMSR